jgi:hypothetical protein
MKGKMATIKIFFLIVTVVLGLVSGTVGTAYAIMHGQPDGNGHPYVGAVIDFTTGMFCSGVAVSPTVLVTAAHCFDEGVPFVAVTFDPAPPHYFIFGEFIPHPDFCLGCGPGIPGFDTHDVAVVLLPAPLDLAEYAELPPLGLVDTLPMRTDVTVVGYGVQNFIVGGGPPEPLVLQTRYFATTKLIQSNHKHSDEYMKLTANPAQGKGGFCFGDSGGPNLLDDTNIILGTPSYVANPMCAGVGYSNRIDTDYALEFINEWIILNEP